VRAAQTSKQRPSEIWAALLWLEGIVRCGLSRSEEPEHERYNRKPDTCRQ
jgi:hypothetical protein